MDVIRKSERLDSECGTIDGRRLVYVLLVVMTSFASGIYCGRNLPTTLLTRPAATLRLMREYPIGSDVYPLNTHDARDHFGRFGWGDKPATVVGYEAVTFKEKELMLCNVRTRQGAGLTLAVNPKWIESSR